MDQPQLSATAAETAAETAFTAHARDVVAAAARAATDARRQLTAAEAALDRALVDAADARITSPDLADVLAAAAVPVTASAVRQRIRLARLRLQRPSPLTGGRPRRRQPVR